MAHREPSSAEHVVGLQAEEEEGQANERPRTQQARQGRPGGVAWHGRWLLCNLGYRLVALGAWLEGWGLSRNARRR
jgi:hypothetical protein